MHVLFDECKRAVTDFSKRAKVISTGVLAFIDDLFRRSSCINMRGMARAEAVKILICRVVEPVEVACMKGQEYKRLRTAFTCGICAWSCALYTSTVLEYSRNDKV